MRSVTLGTARPSLTVRRACCGVSIQLCGWLAAAAFSATVSACESATCAEPGFELNGSCVTGDELCDISCGAHEVCEPTETPQVCKCAPGYSGEPCTWTGVVRDSGFGGLEDELGEPFWQDDGSKGAVVLPLAPGSRNLGEGALAASVLCAAGSLAQVLQMPSYEVGEPLIAELTYTAEAVHGLAVGFDRTWIRLPATGPSWETRQVCLGEGAYGAAPNGGPVTLRLSASERLADCLGSSPAGRIRVDELVIRPAEAGQCPEPGEVVNAMAELDEGGWRFTAEGDASAGLEPLVGREGGSGAQLSRGAGSSDRATMSTRLSVPVPTSLPNAALRFWWRGTSGRLFEAELGTFVDLDDRGRRVETLAGTGAPQVHIYCLPPWTHGSVLDLSFSVAASPPVDTEGLTVDEVEIVSDPDCPEESELADPGFESAPNRWLGTKLGSVAESISLVRDSGIARGGEGTLELSYWTSGPDVSMESYVIVPQSEMDRGPALTFWSKSPSSPSLPVRWLLGRDEQIQGAVQTEADWSLNEVCLPADWAGRWFRVQLRAEATDTAPEPISRERIFLDDFALGTSSACPTD